MEIKVPNIFYTIPEFSLISTFYLLTFKKESFKTILKLCYIFFLIVATAYILFSHGTTFDSLPATVESIFIIVFSILFFYEKLSDIEIVFIYDTKDFWIVSGFLIAFSATLLLFNFIHGLSTVEANRAWVISQLANILKNVLLAIAFTRPVYKYR